MMATHSDTDQHDDRITTLVGYLIVIAVAFRGYSQYPHVRIEIVALTLTVALLLLIEPLIEKRHRAIQFVYLIMHLVVVTMLFVVELDGDIWSVLLLPYCVFAVRNFEQPIGWIWVGIGTLVISILLIIGHDVYAPGYIAIYLAAYLLVSSYALTLRKSQQTQAESQDLLRQIQEANHQLRLYNKNVEELTAIKERNRLARDLHDSVTQTIFSMTLITQTALMSIDKQPEQIPPKLKQLQDLAQAALSEMRVLISQLRSLSVTDDGLGPVLQKHIADIPKPPGLTIRLVPLPEELPLSVMQQQEVFRIIQEALNNVIKHAQAQNAVVEIRIQSDVVQVIISDDGVGFEDHMGYTDKTHIGLDSMRERAHELNGHLAIVSESGTQVTVTVPIQYERKQPL